MAWGVLRRFSPLKKLRDYVRGVDQREMQRQSDLYRLFLYTQLREKVMEGAGGKQLASAADELVNQVRTLSACSRLVCCLATGEQGLHVAATLSPNHQLPPTNYKGEIVAAGRLGVCGTARIAWAADRHWARIARSVDRSGRPSTCCSRTRSSRAGAQAPGQRRQHTAGSFH